MRLGDLFTKIWFCTNLTDGIRPLCTPNDPHADGVVCGYRWTANFIPEDFEPIRGIELVRPEAIEELAWEIGILADQIVATALKREPLEIRRERLLKTEAGVSALLEEARKTPRCEGRVAAYEGGRTARCQKDAHHDGNCE